LRIGIYAKYSPLPSACPVGSPYVRMHCNISTATVLQHPSVDHGTGILACRMRNINTLTSKIFRDGRKMQIWHKFRMRIRSEERVMDWMRLEALFDGRC
jgi:hypothetical protein